MIFNKNVFILYHNNLHISIAPVCAAEEEARPQFTPPSCLKICWMNHSKLEKKS